MKSTLCEAGENLLSSASRTDKKFPQKSVLVLSLLMALGVAPINVVHARNYTSEEMINYNIPAGALGDALNEFALQAGIAISFDSALVSGMSSNGLSGSTNVADAINVLLTGTGLKAVGSLAGYRLEKQVKSSGPIMLKPIKVEGTKRDVLMSETNASVFAYTSQTFQNQSITETSELYSQTPNVQATVSGEGDFSIRGIDFRGETGSHAALTGSVYIDGIYQSILAVEAGPNSLFDVEQVEIYRGVQSTIQGRNALAGAIFVESKDPTYEWEVTGLTQLAEQNTRRYAIAGGGALIEDQVAIRASIDKKETDGFLVSSTADIDDMNFDDSETRRVKLLVEPEAIEKLSLLFTYLDSEGFASTGFGTNVANGPDFFARSTVASDASLLRIDTASWAMEANYEISNKFTLEFLATRSDAEEISGPRFGELDIATASFYDISTDNEEVDTLELRGIWSSDKLGLVAGIYSFEEERETTRSLFAADFAHPVLGVLDLYIASGGAQSIDNEAIFFDGDYRFNDTWSLLFGARYDRETFSEQGYNQLSPNQPIDVDALPRNDTTTDFNAFLPKLGVRWDHSDDLSLSLTLQRGYKAGGAAIDNTNTAYSFDPEYTNNIELALRSSLLNGRMDLNANLFFTQWNEQQVFVELDIPGPVPITQIDNAGESQLYGLEIDTRVLLTDKLTLRAGLGLLQTEFKEFSNAVTGEDFSGNEFAQSPEMSLSAGLNYEHGNGFYAAADGRYQSSAFSESANIPEHEISGYFVMNAKFGYRSENYSVSMFIRNLLDKDYLVRVRNVNLAPDNPEQWQANVGDPRQIGVEFTFDF